MKPDKNGRLRVVSFLGICPDSGKVLTMKKRWCESRNSTELALLQVGLAVRVTVAGPRPSCHWDHHIYNVEAIKLELHNNK